MKLEPGKYYKCTCCGRAYKRTTSARRPYLPCGHFTGYVVEISKDEYQQQKAREKQRRVT